MGLNLYAKVESYLDFEEEVRQLHKAFLGLLYERQPQSVIDIGCGQGAFLQHLQTNGVKAFGIDLSSEQIKVCQAKGLAAQCLSLEEVSQTFDCATAIFDVINYIPKQHLKIFFEQSYLVLNQGGTFVFDVNSLFGFQEVAQGSLNINLDDKFIAIDALFEQNILRTDITLFSLQKSGLYSKEQDFIEQYYHTTKELKTLLESVGFAVESVVNFNLHGYEESDKLIFVCKKS
ncbi:class I SAM-dependent DNA methyltransferase [Candidatus Marinarcus aquaticus]|uniref:Methyltransferase n=1 Tax=Candidatus Marinarcus aquaticus TaxID=2044504 RepID=A0A4Q0XRD6_9BACT|nr:class I SAM-dependent methyltransferase [Candidatus Marinarcus aquaticus]RXJ57627.1 methyltransferase [Candidatus Marinarcus aquaticus]